MSTTKKPCTLPDPFHAKQKFIVGVSGGKDSDSVLLWMVKESGIPHNQIIAIFADTQNEHAWTYDHIRMLSEKVFPITTIHPECGSFFDLCVARKGFPGAKRRFCTEHLKILPCLEFTQGIRGLGFEPISISGVRSEESPDRSHLTEWDYSGNLLCKQWRPLISWSLQDVVEIHRKYDVPMNPLYALGARRVGCFPCMMSIKKEIRLIALNFPEKIDEIRRWESKMEEIYGHACTFFRVNVCPPRFCTTPYTCEDGRVIMIPKIDDVVCWSMTGHRAEGTWIDNPEKEAAGCNSGFCE